jgi:hypothetical protein
LVARDRFVVATSIASDGGFQSSIDSFTNTGAKTHLFDLGTFVTSPIGGQVLALDASSNLLVQDVGGGATVRISPNVAGPPGVNWSTVAVTPDGSRVVFTPLSAVDYSFWSASTSTGVATQLPNTHGEQAGVPVMSPDGSHFLYDYASTSAMASTTLGNQIALPARGARFTSDSGYLFLTSASGDLTVVSVASGTSAAGPTPAWSVSPARDDKMVYDGSNGIMVVAAGDVAHPKLLGVQLNGAATPAVNPSGTIAAYSYANGGGIYAVAIP